MLEDDRTAICGPRYAHQADRTAARAGPVASEVVLGGRKVAIRRRASKRRPLGRSSKVSSTVMTRPSGERGDQRIQERRLARARTPRDQDVAPATGARGYIDNSSYSLLPCEA